MGLIQNHLKPLQLRVPTKVVELIMRPRSVAVNMILSVCGFLFCFVSVYFTGHFLTELLYGPHWKILSTEGPKWIGDILFFALSISPFWLVTEIITSLITQRWRRTILAGIVIIVIVLLNRFLLQ